jgi:hypothetical protein
MGSSNVWGVLDSVFDTRQLISVPGRPIQSQRSPTHVPAPDGSSPPTPPTVGSGLYGYMVSRVDSEPQEMQAGV